MSIILSLVIGLVTGIFMGISIIAAIIIKWGEMGGVSFDTCNGIERMIIRKTLK